MDFGYSETQQELVGLTQKILSDRMTLEHVKNVERSEEGFDRSTWQELAKANVLGIAVPEAQGGLGLGFLDLCLVLREAGKHVPPLPLIPCLVSSVLPWVRYGTPEQLAATPQVVNGEFITTAALCEHGTDAEHPYTTATPDGNGGYTVSGVKTTVPCWDIAQAALIPARVEGTDDVVILGMSTTADGVTAERQIGQNYEHIFEVTLSNVHVAPGDVLGTPELGREILHFMIERTMVAMSALVGGVCEQAMRITAQYTIDRKQFDRQIGTFQAVSQRMADAYINCQGIELTMLQAATHLDEGLDVPEEVATAKWWASEGGNQIGHACLHVHGGVSIDLDYPIHRYFLWIKQAEFTMGSATAQLLRLGKLLSV